jgi:hypothetical protein
MERREQEREREGTRGGGKRASKSAREREREKCEAGMPRVQNVAGVPHTGWEYIMKITACSMTQVGACFADTL